MLNKKIQTAYEKIKTLTEEIHQMFDEEEIKQIKKEYSEIQIKLSDSTKLSDKSKLRDKLRNDNFWEIHSVFSLIILKEHLIHEEEYNNYCL